MDDPRYQAIIHTIHDQTLKAGKRLGGPFNCINRKGFSFFQAAGEAALIKAGAKGHYEY